jgi:diguanylate cyclase (GGDEF)-like protein
MTTDDERRVERLRPVPTLIAAVVVFAGSVVLLAADLTEQRIPAAWGWTLSIAGAAIAGWACLPMRSREGRRRALVRFALDAATVGITVCLFAWYLTSRLQDPRNASGSGTVPVIMLINGAMLFVVLAADRQRRAAGVAIPERRRRAFSFVPYAAVAATDALLLVIGHSAGSTVFTVAVGAVLLTALVVFRQVNALGENARLLRRVDANLVQLTSYQSQLAHRATHDALTDLANRTLFEQQTREALASIGPGATLSLALIDLDDFKTINDRLGHAVGDALLIVVAQRLREAVREGDVVARLGGDEFGLLLHGLRSGEATEVLERIAESLTRPVHALGYDLLVNASIGLSEVWPDASPQELLRRADLAMYAAKERGKGRHAVYDAKLEQDQAADAQLGAELRQALDNGDFTLVYQPIVSLPGGERTSLETLIRWRHPERGFIGPDVFIPIAERTGMIVPLGDWILRTALAQAAEWQRVFGSGAPGEIGVNVSARQLREPGFAADVRAALADTGFDPEKLVVEVTETAVFDGGIALDTLQELVTLGVRIALDDFGTGHSSLGLLRTCPADILKVDKSFVDGIGGRSEEAVIATAMIQITNGLHLQAIAEGVETAGQAETLYRLGYRYAQGYHFSRPLSPEQVSERLTAAAVLAV